MVPEITALEPDIRSPDCPSRRILGLIADKWTMLVVYVLAQGTHRHGELRREVGGVSQKVLTQTLRSLEREGVVERTVHPVVPPRVEYALTPHGRTLIEPLEALRRWVQAAAAAELAGRCGQAPGADPVRR